MAGYIGSKASVVSSGVERKKTYSITGSTTSLTGLNYTVGKVHVFQNGVRLLDGTDYTATNGTSITLTVAAQSGDNVVVVSQASFQLSESYTSTEADAEFVTKTGDTITGNVSFTNGNKAIFGGTGQGELEIYAHATNNNVYISENAAGNLNLGADSFNIYTDSFSKQVASFTGGSAKLLNDGNEKLATTSTGIDVTGTAVVDGLTSTGLTTVNMGAETSPLRVGSTGNDAAVSYSNASTPTAYNVRAGMSDTDDFSIWTSDTKRLTVKDNGNVGIATTSASEKLSILGNVNIGNNDVGNPLNYLRFGATQHGAADIRPTDEGGHKVGLDFYTDGTGDVTINPTFAMRIDSSGNLLVGTTALTNISSSGTGNEGAFIQSYGHLGIAVSNDRCATFNRKTSNGDIVQFRKDGTTVGNITTNSAGNIHINSQNGTFALRTINVERYAFDQEQIYPWNNGECNLGLSYRRFDVVYAATGSINTSDQTQKQDIESLTATEMLVGKRLSALFKTFRWKNRVAEKGDSARTHTGIMAQDVQTAFTAEGLDASNYALFCSDTWWEHDVEVPAVEAVAEETDEDGNVTTEAVEAVDAYTRTDEYKTEDEAPEGAISKTLLGIRYPELLSFVAAYNEQRFASIEARLTALEA